MKTTTLTGIICISLIVLNLGTMPIANAGAVNDACNNAVYALGQVLAQYKEGMATTTDVSGALADAFQACESEPPVTARVATETSSLGDAQVGTTATNVVATSHDCSAGVVTSENHATLGFSITVPTQGTVTFPNNFASGQYIYDSTTGDRTYTGSDLFLSFIGTAPQLQAVNIGPVEQQASGTITVLGVTVPAQGSASTPGCAVAGAQPCQGSGEADYSEGGLEVAVYGILDTCAAG